MTTAVEETIRAISVGGEVFFKTFLRRNGANRLRKLYAATSGVVTSLMAAGIIWSASFCAELKPLVRDLVRDTDRSLAFCEAPSHGKTTKSRRRTEPDLQIIVQNVFHEPGVGGLKPLPQRRQTLGAGACAVSAASNAVARVEPASSANNEHGPNEHADRFLDDTVQFWKPRLERELSREDARQIAENVAGFFKVLLDWDVTEDRQTRGVQSV